MVKGIDAITREQLAQLVVISGLDRLNPVLSSMILPGGLKPTILIPVVTQEDEIVLNNVRRIVGFLSAGTPSSRSLSQVICPLSSSASRSPVPCIGGAAQLL